MSREMVLFIDAQNMYQRARGAFFNETDSHVLGQFNPVALGHLICAKRPLGHEEERSVIKEVRVYTGRPDSSIDPKTYAAHRRQCAAWEGQGVLVRARTLRYPRDWPRTRAQEKGVDVLLAIDFVTMAIEGAYDIGVVASTDTDLIPAIEYVMKRPGITVEVAAWYDSGPKGLSVSGMHLWCHRLTRADYDAVADHGDYNITSL